MLPEISLNILDISENSVSAKATEIKIVAEHITKLKKKLNTILAKNTKKSLKTIENDTERDHYLDAEEALEYGLIDKIIKKKN